MIKLKGSFRFLLVIIFKKKLNKVCVCDLELFSNFTIFRKKRNELILLFSLKTLDFVDKIDLCPVYTKKKLSNARKIQDAITFVEKILTIKTFVKNF